MKHMKHLKKRSHRPKRSLILLTLAMMIFAGVLSLTGGTLIASADSSSGALSVTKFATPEQLVDANNFALYQESGSKTTAVAQKVYFGTNGEEAQGWYIAGGEDTDGNGSMDLVLLCDPDQPFTHSTFHSDVERVVPSVEGYNVLDTKGYDVLDTKKNTNKNTGDYEGEETPAEVYVNHYGSSDIRTYLNSLVTDYSDFFTAAQINLMIPTTIYTDDLKNNKVYSTTDKLYLGYGVDGSNNYITVGSNQADNLNSGLTVGTISDYGTDYSPYSRGGIWFWLRAPCGESWATVALTGSCVTNCRVYYSGEPDYYYDERCNVVPAFSLDLSSVLFASAASASTGNATFDSGFTFRFNAVDGDTSKILSTATYKSSSVTVTADGNDSGIYLYVQGNDGTDDWVYSTSISETTTVTASDIQSAKNLSSSLDLKNCKIWLETTDASDKLTYAKMATEDVTVTVTPVISIVNNSSENNTSSENNETNGNDDGKVKIHEEKQKENYTESGLANDSEELKDLLLTEEDKETLTEGEDITVWVEVQDNKENTPEEDIQVVNEKLPEGYDVGIYLDVTLWKQVGQNEAVKITKVSDGKVKIALVVPTDLQKDGRSYQIIRVHEGVATVLDTELDPENFCLTFETDEFSTYALVYTDTQEEEPGDTEEGDEPDTPEGTDKKIGDTVKDDSPDPSKKTDADIDDIENNSTPNASEENDTDSGITDENTNEKISETNDNAPNTGDSNQLIGWSMLLLASLCGITALVVVLVAYRKNEK